MPERLLLDAAMGTALIGAGLPAGALPEEWVLSRPEAVAEVHRAHAAAGAGLVLTCTFNLAGPRLAARGLGVRAKEIEIAARAVALARGAGARWVAGAVGPTALSPLGAPGPPRAELAPWYRSAFRALAAAGADMLWVESLWDLEEARAALAEGRALGFPVAVTLAPPAPGPGDLRLPSGMPLADALRALAAEGAHAVGVNCALPGTPIADLARSLAGLGVPLVMKPSAGLPGQVISPEAFAAWVAEVAGAGAGWVGGCCGASPAHLAALAAALRASTRL